MMIIKNGTVQNPYVELKFNGKSSLNEHTEGRKKMTAVNGIVVHQTYSPDAASAMNSMLQKGANSGHFLIDLDGKIYQTLSLDYQANHVGRIHSRCIREMSCTPSELPELERLYKNSAANASRIHQIEQKKPHSDRYSTNADSIGIECVGMAYRYDKYGKLSPDQKDGPGKKEKIYDDLTDAQKQSLKWLTKELSSTLNVEMSNVFVHSDIAWKNPTEAISAKDTIQELQKEEAENTANSGPAM